MNIELYVIQHEKQRAHCEGLDAFLREAGHSVTTHEATSVAGRQHAESNTALSIFYGLGGEVGRIKEEQLAAGKMAAVMEFGYLNRYEYVGVSLLSQSSTTHNNSGDFLASARKPDDRLLALGGQEATEPKRSPGRPSKKTSKTAVILGQVPGDTQLGGVDLETWTRDCISTLQSVGYEVDFRADPKIAPSKETLTEALKRADIVAAVNSTALVEAIQIGTPFICSDHCQYAPMATDNIVTPKAKTIEERQQFLANLAYCQYNPAEFRDGSAWAHLVELAKMRGQEIE